MEYVKHKKGVERYDYLGSDGTLIQDYVADLSPYVRLLADVSNGIHTIVEYEDTQAAADKEGLAYQRLRAMEYNKKSIAEQMEMRYDDLVNGTNTWVEWIQAVKATYPKPV